MTDSAEWATYVSTLLSIERRLRSSLWRYTRNHADTDELLQDSYARLLSIDLETIRTIRSVPRYAAVVARRLALDWLKHRKVLPMESLSDGDVLVMPGGSTFTEDLVNGYQEIEQLMRRVARLPSKCGQVFTLRRMFGFTPKEIGQMLNIAVHTVEQHLLKATRRLRGSPHPSRGVPTVSRSVLSS